MRKVSLEITFKLDIVTKLLLFSCAYTATLIPVKHSNVDLVIMVFKEGYFLMLQSAN